MFHTSLFSNKSTTSDIVQRYFKSISLEISEHLHSTSVYQYSNAYLAFHALLFLNETAIACKIQQLYAAIPTHGSKDSIEVKMKELVAKACEILDSVSFEFDSSTVNLFEEALKNKAMVSYFYKEAMTFSQVRYAHSIAEVCLFDRFAAIVPAGIPYDLACQLLPNTYLALRYTGILYQMNKKTTAYHLTSRENVAEILKYGLSQSVGEFQSFGDGVYAFEEFSRFSKIDFSKYAVIKILYDGPYLKAIHKQDDKAGEVILHPNFIQEVSLAK